jgi:flagellar biogenesis protein FliO
VPAPSPSPTLALARRAPNQPAARPAVHGAVTHAAGHAATGAQSVSASSLLVQMVVGLVVIIVLIKVASRFVQGRSGRGRGIGLGLGSRTPAVSVVGRQSLGKGVQVAMVAAGNQTYLLGVTQRQVTLLGEVDTGAGADGLAAADGDRGVGALQLLPGGSVPALGPEGPLPVWRSAIEQMRVRTVRRA